MARKKIDIKEIVQKYACELKKRGVTPKQIILYGSYASGKPHLGSDIDLVVISPDLAKMHPIKKLEFLSLATIDINAPIEAMGYTPNEIKKKGKDSIFWDIIQKTGKVVYQS